MDEEDIIAKMQYLENVAEKYRYKPPLVGSSSFSLRVKNAIQRLPEEHRKAALVLFANIIFIPEPLLDEAWREAAFSFEKMLSAESTLHFSDTLYIALDDPGLVANFSRISSLKGREDHDKNPGFGTVSGIIDELYGLIKSNEPNPDMQRIKTLIERKNWVILADNAISGGSLASDVKKLSRLQSILFRRGSSPLLMANDINFTVPKVFAVVQLITDQAFTILNELIPRERVAYGLRFDDGTRIILDKCKLFHREDTLKDVRMLCEWFGDEYFLDKSDPEFRKRIEEHVERGGFENYAYGWKDCGYTIVTQNNALSNSVPLIYYTPPLKTPTTGIDRALDYEPPFPRVESRDSHQTSRDSDKLLELEKWESIKIIQERINASQDTQ